MPILCISASRFFVDILSVVKKNKPLSLLSLGAISIILSFALANTIILIAHNENSRYFASAIFVDHYLRAHELTDSSNSGIIDKNVTIISTPFFVWVQKYKFHNDNYISYFQIPEKLKFKTENILSIIDPGFSALIHSDDYTGNRFRNIFASFDTKTLATFQNGSSQDNKISILLTDFEKPNTKLTNVSNLLDKITIWRRLKICRNSTKYWNNEHNCEYQ